jgi:hypothetical protein
MQQLELELFLRKDARRPETQKKLFCWERERRYNRTNDDHVSGDFFHAIIIYIVEGKKKNMGT